MRKSLFGICMQVVDGTQSIGEQNYCLLLFLSFCHDFSNSSYPVSYQRLELVTYRRLLKLENRTGLKATCSPHISFTRNYLTE